MLPVIAPPTPEKLAQFMAEHAHRYPEKATVDAIGDGGELLRLPLLLANPTGTSKSPTGAPAFPAWDNLIANTLGARKSTGVTAELTRDCLLFPDRGTLALWEERWPALVDSIGKVMLLKIGADAAFIRAPGAGEKPPEAIASLLAATPAAMWRWVDKGPAPLPVAIMPPTKAHWDALTAALAREGADCVAMWDELVAMCVKGEGAAAVIRQWPGLSLPLENIVVKMAGAAADARLGEW